MFVILNRAAGGPKEKPGEETDTIRQLLEASGEKVRIVTPDEGKDLSALAREAAASDDPVVVAGGGDGTISGVAAALAGSGKTLGVLPLGTLNHFAKDLGIPLDLPAAIQVITSGNSFEVDLGEVNERTFINNSSLGIYPEIVASREAQQEEVGRGKWPAFFWAGLHAFHRFPFLDLKITIEGERIARRTAFLFVGNNQYEIAGFNLGARKCMNAGKLGLYLTHRTGRLGLLRLAFRALFGRLEQAEDFDVFCVEEATIETRRRQLLVATDGEVTTMTTPLHYRIRPRALRVFIPRKPS